MFRMLLELSLPWWQLGVTTGAYWTWAWYQIPALIEQASRNRHNRGCSESE